MFRLCICALALVCAAQAGFAGIVKQDSDRTFVPTAPNGGDNSIFEELNQKLRRLKPVKGDPNFDKEGLIQDREGKGTVNARNTFLCPICNEPYFKHQDERFVCVPKDADGNPIAVKTIQQRAGTCPVCNARFIGSIRCNENDKAGVDRDYCMHSLGKITVHSSVWACPDCGYAALTDKFNQAWNDGPVPPKAVELVKGKLQPAMRKRMLEQIGVTEEQLRQRGMQNVDRFSEYVPQEQIKDWIKYDNAIAIYREEKAPHVLLARLYMEAAWACRREMNAEILIPFLPLFVQEGISSSIRRIQNDIIGACLQIRRDRNIGVLFDPNHPETDPQILTDAAKMIIEYGEKEGRRLQAENQNNANAKAQFYTNGDMYVLYIRLAGFLDRLGKMDEADQALNLALKFVPNDAKPPAGEQVDEEVAKYIDKQLIRIRSFIEERKKCLLKEREYLARAMWENLAAIDQKEIRFYDGKSWLNSTDKEGMDPATTAYMLGELARRTGEPGAAPLWFQAAKKIVEHQAAALDAEEKGVGKDLASASYKPQRDRADALRLRWDTVREWTTEQLTQTKYGGEIDSNIKQVLDATITAAGLDPKKMGAIDAGAAADALAMTNKKIESPGDAHAKPAPEHAAPAAPAAQTSVKTREALYTMYYLAIQKYVKEKQANPPDLATLVKEHYIPPADSCLDGKGRLICPETQEPLNYFKSFVMGESNDFIIFAGKGSTKATILYADGAIRAPGQSKRVKSN